MDKNTVSPKTKGRKSYELFGDIYRLREEARETWDNFYTDELMYRTEQSRDGAVVQEGVSYVENYINSHIWLEFLIVFGGDSQNALVLIIESVKPPNGLFIAPMNGSSGFSDEQKSVFVESNKSVQKEQQVAFIRSIPSVVRLKLLNKPESFSVLDIANGLCALSQTPTISLTQDRKLNVKFFRDVFWMYMRQFPRKIIKRATKVCNYIANYCAPFQRRFLLSRKRIDVFNIEINGLIVGTKNLQNILERAAASGNCSPFINEVVHKPIKGIDMFVRPISFDDSTIKWMHNSRDLANEMIREDNDGNL